MPLDSLAKAFESFKPAATRAVQANDAQVADRAAQALGRDGLSLSGAATDSSVIHFDASNPRVQSLLEKLGLKRSGEEATLSGEGTYAHISTDGWKTTQDVPLQYLHDNTQGFLLRDVAPGTPVQYAVHADLATSYNHFYSYDQKGEGWVNAWGDNFQGTTEINR
ncbi:MAG TPA: hypothetical protein V6D47_06370 [Oscillatoriaceae cyanobacterium]